MAHAETLFIGGDPDAQRALERLLRPAATFTTADSDLVFGELTIVLGELLGEERVSSDLRRRLGWFVFIAAATTALGCGDRAAILGADFAGGLHDMEVQVETILSEWPRPECR